MICKICNKEIKNFHSLSQHIVQFHKITTKEYYDLYLKKDNEGQCLFCGNTTLFYRVKQGYRKFCTRKCLNKYTIKFKTRIKVQEWFITPCSYCGKEKSIPVKYSGHDNYFCNKTCYNLFHKANRKLIFCKYCKKELEVYEGSPQLYCNRDCYKKDFKPANFGKFAKKGYFISNKLNSKIWYDSSYELTRLKQLEEDSTVIFFERCPYKIKYYAKDNTYHYYSPDFLITYQDNTQVIEEIKGIFKENDVLKMNAAVEFCKDKNIKYKILEMEDIFKVDSPESIFIKYSNKYGDFIRTTFESVFMKCAFDLKTFRSSCLRNKVGCIITDYDYWNIHSIGYNGDDPGENNECVSLDPGKCGCTHAEENALNKIKDNKYPNGLTMFITLAPCLSCAKKIIEFGFIKKVIFYEAYRDTSGIRYLKKHGLEILKYQNLVDSNNSENFHILKNNKSKQLNKGEN